MTASSPLPSFSTWPLVGFTFPAEYGTEYAQALSSDPNVDPLGSTNQSQLKSNRSV